MANYGLELVAKIIYDGNFALVEHEGITLDHFVNPDGEVTENSAYMIFEYIQNYWQDRDTSGNVPSLEMITERFPTVDLPRPSRLDMKATITNFKNAYLKHQLDLLSVHIASRAHEPDQCLADIQARVIELTKVERVSQDVVLSQSVNSLVARYNANKEQRLRGIPYPWDVLNNETRGMIPGEFILLYGRPKSLKTWILLKISTHAYDYGSRRVLIYTREMSPEQMMDRCICLLIGAPYSAFKKGKLSEISLPDGGTMEDRFYDVSSTLHKDEETCTLETGFHKSIIITKDRDGRGGGGVSGLKQKAIDHEADLICVDAMYLMRNDRRRRKSIKWDDQSDITQDTKDVASELNRPLVGTNQANRPSEEKRGHSMANIAFADAYGMNCDLAIEINKKTTRDPEVNELAMAITGAREINLNGFAIHGCPATNFEMMMRPVLNDKGVAQLDDAGNKMMEPVVFYENKDIRDFFKGADDEKDAHNSGRFRPQLSKGEMTKWAREHFSASKRQ